MTEIETDQTKLTVEPDTRAIEIRRGFDAPREQVFEAYVDPDRIPDWWGPRRYETIVDEMDARPGGQWRFVSRDDEGNEYGFRGVYHDVVAPERIVQTWEFEGSPGDVSLETATFEDVDGRTRMTAQSVFQTVEARDANAESGMQEGARETWERLAELVEESETGREA
ncbi:SRPBCC family protein [Natrinema soli]|uniref:SRPBCC family protein n=1 Tax=Natrinema soli TaxID=1930624 RepID=A0ABD5SFK1_9EURY|nr:SRPBCC family protein [Natrinema soli]